MMRNPAVLSEIHSKIKIIISSPAPFESGPGCGDLTFGVIIAREVKNLGFLSDKYSMIPKLSFEKFLVEHHVLTADALKVAQEGAASGKQTLFAYLIERAILPEEALAQSLAKFHALEYQPGPLPMNTELLAQLPAFTLRRYKIIPLSKDNQKITVATSNPSNFLATDELRRLTKLEVKMVCTTENAITEALKYLEGAPRTEKDKSDTTTASHIEQILIRSIDRMASDLHFEPQVGGAIVRERIDGTLYEAEKISLEAFWPVISRLKLLCGMDIVEKRLCQDGRFKYQHPKGTCEIRGSTLPTIFGEKLVLRLLRSDTAKPSLERLDIGAERMAIIDKICGLPDGLVVMAGPTGSGKSTTIYAMLSRLDRHGQNLITLEDPVEYELEMANQVQINTKIGVTFASLLPAILRQDPDIILVGEMRDEKTTQMVMRAAITGHLVFSTIHAPSAIDTIARIEDMEIPPHMQVAALKASISQRLLRRLCSHCKKPYDACRADKEALGISNSQSVKLYKEGGCEHCHGLGYLGRFAILEILMMSDALRDAITKRERRRLEEIARSEGFRTLREQGGTMGEALSKVPLIPGMMVSMITMGEESGTIDALLDRVATLYENETDIF